MATPAKAPISQHRAFPVIVASWFAALLGFGTLVMPIILLERVVEVTGLGQVVPAANPPLGQTAHLLVSLGAGVLGALLGFVVARQVAKAHSPHHSGKPILDVRQEIDEPHLLPREPFEAAGTTPEESAAMPLAAELFEEAEETGAVVEEEVDGGELTETPIEQFPTFAELERRREQRRASGGSAPGQLERRLFLRRSDDEPLAFAAPSRARLAPDNENNTAPRDPVDGEQALAQFTKAAPPTPAAPAAPSWQREPLEELGLVQLVERLGSSLAQRRALAAAPAPAPVPTAATPVGFEVAPPEDAAQAVAAYLARPAMADTPASEEEPDTSNESDFGSLLSLRPAGPAAAQPDDALRQALATLQRMSGAA